MSKVSSWSSLAQRSSFSWSETALGAATNAYAKERIFDGRPPRVVFYRDNHAWCPYCQKVWLFLEEARISYRVRKVTMRCYGTKESWYKERVPNGMLPAIELDGKLITESDDILIACEKTFAATWLSSMLDPNVVQLRRLERLLFRAWCQWLCYEHPSPASDDAAGRQFAVVMTQVEKALAETDGPFFLAHFSVADIVFIPYVERMCASLFYYKGYDVKHKHPRIGAWFRALETRSTYRGTQSDYHTHVHDLPPQMGGCYSNKSEQALANQKLVDQGPFCQVPDVYSDEPANCRQEALAAILKHRETLCRVNPMGAAFDIPLHCAMETLMDQVPVKPPAGSAGALRYLRDRISVPRDMSIWAARRLREALELTAALDGPEQSPVAISDRHRMDQNPAPFGKN